MDILHELEENQTILLLVSSGQYNEIILEVIKQLSGKKVAYISLNKTFSSLKENFEKKGIDTKNFVFVDCITKSIKDVPDMTDGCYYVSRPDSFTELGITISKLLKHDFQYVIFDSIANILAYRDKKTVIKFMSNIVVKVKSTKAKGVFYSLISKENELVVQEAGTFVDKVITL